MGLDINGAQFFISARRRGVGFGDVLTLGRQSLHVFPPKMVKELVRAGLPPGAFAKGGEACEFAEPLFECLGASSVSAMDASDFEGARYVQDLNEPIPDGLRERFDTVFDGGTLEHIFNFPQGLKNCMEMVRPGGRLFIHNCANNLCGHGFYQFSPELFFRAFSPDNGFEIERVVIHVIGPYGRWYEVNDPNEVKSRVLLMTSVPIMILVEAKRTKVVPIFAKAPQQSDYSVMWREHDEGGAASKAAAVPPTMARKQPWLAGKAPGLARFMSAMKTGWHFFHDQSLRNRKFYRRVGKD